MIARLAEPAGVRGCRVSSVGIAEDQGLGDWFDFPFNNPDLFEGPRDYCATIASLDFVSRAVMRRSDVVEVAHVANGRNDGPPWLAVVRLADARWVYMSFTSQITGDVFWTIVVAPSKARLWWWALTDDDRERLGPQLTAEEREEELVQIDELLESPDPDVRARGEARMLQRHRGS